MRKCWMDVGSDEIDIGVPIDALVALAEVAFKAVAPKCPNDPLTLLFFEPYNELGE